MESRHDPFPFLMHYGTIRRSGRYPYGSGGQPYQEAKDFRGYLEDMRGQGMTDGEIAQALGMKSPEFRDRIAYASEQIHADNVSRAVRYREKGNSPTQIAERMLGDKRKESTVRGWLKAAETIKDNTITAISGRLRDLVSKFGFLDVGAGTELHMGISKVKLRAAVHALESEGYKLHLIKIRQLGTADNLTEMKVLSPPGTTWGEARKAVTAGLVYNVTDKSPDGGLTFLTPDPDPVSISSKRIAVRYGNEGGSNMDGVIEVRRGVPELDLGSARYAQVRVAVDGTHYLKGMAMYADDLPAGMDIRYNTPKMSTGNKLDTMKPLKTGPTDAGHPFGAITRPHVYKDKNGKEITSALNMVNEEGAWDDWSRNLSSQFLSKQPIALASAQLAKAQASKQKDFDEINALTHPLVRRQLLLDFADSADAAAVGLKAAALPKQSSHVILPITSMRPTEVYAPNFDDGTRVALVRHPHGGPFEIPQLTVNNKNAVAKRIMGPATDAIGIHPSVAQQLSGADFDGDSVVVIPNNSGRVKSQNAIKALEDFDPKVEYSEQPGMKYMTPESTQREMGKISNLITDMSIKHAPTEDIVRAVKHSMVVIDAEKHSLNYKQSEKDNGIAALKKDYQGGANKGAATLISRSGKEMRVPQRRLRRQSEGGKIDPKTGELVYVETGKMRPYTKTNKRTGEKTTTLGPAQTKVDLGALVKDAHELTSGPPGQPGQPMETVYANHANAMKAMANAARKIAVSIPNPQSSKAAAAVYSKEVASLKAKLKNAQMNAPLERRAQIVANATAKARIEANHVVDKDDIKKITYQSLNDARIQTGANKKRIGSESVPFLTREWEAIQAGALHNTTVRAILNNSDMKKVKALATPRYRSSLTPGQIARAKSMVSAGRNPSEIAAALGIPRSTLVDNLAKT